MIPPDLASALRLNTPSVQSSAGQTQPVPRIQQITDVLSDLQPGQRIMAEVQALLPNGTYRAIVAQREITLALPFSAKAGDSLELEVVDSDGQLTLAVVSNRAAGASSGLTDADPSVPTTLSRAGRLIGDLLGGINEEGKRPSPAPLNRNIPLVDQFPTTGGELAPILKQALTQSGVFYEAHQARWVAGQLPTEALRQEPQGKIGNSPASPTALSSAPPQNDSLAVDTALSSKMLTGPDGNATGGIPREIALIVQQQLDALATQNYAWQGQVWPGQNLWWEISEDPERQRGGNDRADAGRWQTRLLLNLPMLGDIDATLRLRANGAVDLSVMTNSTDSESRLRESTVALRNQLEAAGLSLSQMLVRHGEVAE